jgi:hypothetical protein
MILLNKPELNGNEYLTYVTLYMFHEFVVTLYMFHEFEKSL